MEVLSQIRNTSWKYDQVMENPNLGLKFVHPVLRFRTKNLLGISNHKGHKSEQLMKVTFFLNNHLKHMDQICKGIYIWNHLSPEIQKYGCCVMHKGCLILFLRHFQRVSDGLRPLSSDSFLF